jgi:protein gp37
MEASGIARELGDLVLDRSGRDWTGYRHLVEEWLDKPMHWRKPRVVAAGWLGDMWPGMDDRRFDLRDGVLALASRDRLRDHQFLYLTKNAACMRAHLRTYVRWMRDGFPRNQWFGTTITTQRDAYNRMPHLLRIPGRRWLCVEPILGPVDLERAFAFGTFDTDGTPAIKWIVVGQETGRRPRPAKPEWIQDVIDQCAEACVPVWTKALPPGVQPTRQAPAPIARILRADRKIAAEAERLGVEIEEV